MVIFKAFVVCHDILNLGKSPIKWRQRPDMTLAVDWDVKHQFKQTNKIYFSIYFSALVINDGDDNDESLETEHDKRKSAVS